MMVALMNLKVRRMLLLLKKPLLLVSIRRSGPIVALFRNQKKVVLERAPKECQQPNLELRSYAMSLMQATIELKFFLL